MSNDLLALSSLDGRYARESAALREYFSEFAYLRQRVRIEIEYLLALAHQTNLIRPLSASEADALRRIGQDFTLDEARRVKELEQATRHDVKAIENFLRAKLAPTSCADLVGFVHFGLTSEDVNNLAQALALREARERVLLPALDRVLEQLAALVRAHKSTPMLARTHGQPAVPTTFGKEMAVFYARLRRARQMLAAHRFEGKFNGAVGNFNALCAAAPDVDWLRFSTDFVRQLELEPNLLTTQTLPYENWNEYFQTLQRVHSILLDLAQDLWRYASDGYLAIKAVTDEVGSSTMPHKVNPIDLENAEGNLGLANALLEQFARKLPISRLQRDLSDSTVRRAFGTALGHALVAYTALSRALERVEVAEPVMRSDLEAHWEVIAEGAQTLLRSLGLPDAYEQLKSLTRGRRLSEEAFKQWIEKLPIDEAAKARLRALSPLSYTGLAERLAERALSDER